MLLPAAYYESSILTKQIKNPCEIGNLGLCRHYKYPEILEYNPSYTATVVRDGYALSPEILYEDYDHLSILGEKPLPLITAEQTSLNYVIDVPASGPYYVIVDYVTDRKSSEPYIIQVNLDGADTKDGVVTLYPCSYTTVCRQPVIDLESREKVFYLDTSKNIPITITGDEESHGAIKSVAIVPVGAWSIDLITPSPVCVMQDGHCVQTTYRPVPDSKRVCGRSFFF